MQLFGLVNTLLANDPTSLRKNLRYSGHGVGRGVTRQRFDWSRVSLPPSPVVLSLHGIGF